MISITLLYCYYLWGWLLLHKMGKIKASPAPSLVGSFLFTTVTAFALRANRNVGLDLRLGIIAWECLMMLVSLRKYKFSMRDIEINIMAFASYLAFLHLNQTNFQTVYFQELPKSAKGETLYSYYRKRLS